MYNRLKKAIGNHEDVSGFFERVSKDDLLEILTIATTAMMITGPDGREYTTPLVLTVFLNDQKSIKAILDAEYITKGSYYAVSKKQSKNY